MEDKVSNGDLVRQSSIRASPTLKSTFSGNRSRDSPSFRRSGSVRIPRKDSQFGSLTHQLFRGNRVFFWLMLIGLWAYIGFHVQSKWAHGEHIKTGFIGYKSVKGSIRKQVENVTGTSLASNDNGSAIEVAIVNKNGSNTKIFGVGSLKEKTQESSHKNLSRKRSKRSVKDRRLRKVISQPKDEVVESRPHDLEEASTPKRNTLYGLIVGPFGQTEDRILEWSAEKRRGTCDRQGAFSRIAWSRRFVLVFHELSMTGAPLSMMELATELLSCGATVSVVVLSKKGGLMGELNRRGIKVLNDRGEFSFKTATKADLVIAGSAVCSSWIEPYLAKYPASSSQMVWWIMENRREYFVRSKQMLNRVKILAFLSNEQSKQWVAWCEEEHIQLNMQPMIVPLSVSDELAFVAGIPCSLNTPAFSTEAMLQKRAALRNAIRKEMGLDENDMLVMSLSSINPGKGQRLLLESALLVAEHNVSLKDIHINVRELSDISTQNTNDRNDELILGIHESNSNEASARSQRSKASSRSSKRRRKKHSRTNDDSLDTDTIATDASESRKSRNLLSERQDGGKQSLKVLIGSVGSKSNKVLYVKVILRFLSQHSNLSKIVLWTPATTRVASLYAAADVYVINAQGLGETFGRVTVEAMAFGLPVLGTDAGGTKEIVEHGVTGLLHPLGHQGIQGLAQNIQFLLRNPSARKKMGMNGRLQVQRKYLKENTYKSFAKVLVKCMKVK